MIRLAHEYLERIAAEEPGRIALVTEGRRWTYGQVEEMANRLAQGLLSHGLQRGDRVALHLGNCLEMVVGIFGVMKAGGVFVGISPQVREAKLQAMLADCQPVAILTRTGSPETLRRVGSLRCLVHCGTDPVPMGAAEFHQFLAKHSPVQPPKSGIDLDLACLIYTSGTTAESKGVMCDHSNVVFVTEAVAEYLRNGPEDILLCVLPLAFSYGLYQLFPAFARGATLVLENSFAFPALLLQRLQEEKVTGFAGTPTIFALLLQYQTDRFDLSHLRYMTNAAAGLPVEHVRRLRERFPQVDFYSMHGLTEVARTVYLPPEWVDRKPGSVGIAMPGTEAWVADENGRRLGPGEVGELVIRGRNVMRGYWGRPEATAERFRPGLIPGERVCYTGDLFRTDADGHFYFVARMDDIIKCRGEKVAPREVENVLHQLDGVVEAAVVGVPDPVLGQAVKAFIVRRDDALTAKQVLAYCKPRLEDHMLPRQIEFVAELPKTDSGKVRRSVLKLAPPADPTTA